MSEPRDEPGARPLVLERAADVDAPDMRARLFAAALVTPASIVLLRDPTPLRIVVAAAGLLYAAFAVTASRSARRRSGRPPDTLTFGESTFEVVDHGETRTVAYADVTEIDVADDAATLIVRLGDEPPVTIGAGYGGLGTLRLHEMLERHRDGASRSRRG